MKSGVEHDLLEAKAVGYAQAFRTLLPEVSLGLAPGQVLQVTGRNGSGKSTLLRILAGLITPTTGAVCWQGQALAAQLKSYQQACLFLGPSPALKPKLSLWQNLQLQCALRNQRLDITRAQAALKTLGLSAHQATPAAQLSSGQQRRLGLMKLLLCSAKMWILDEPFAALDANGQSQLKAMIQQFVGEGGRVVLTNHQTINWSGLPMSHVDLDV